MRKVPELRFDGFDGEWEEKKLEDSFNVTMGQSPNSKNYTVDSDSLPLIGGNADIKQGKINPSIFTTQVTKKSYPGNIIMTVRAPVGDLAMNSSEVVIGRGVCSIDGNNYLYYNLEKKKYENYWRRFISGSTFESINSSDIKSVLISFPENYEQEKIGDLFKKIDDLIEIQEDKVSKMKDFKKSMLQKMFPKKDELVPEFRFDGFDGDLEIDKLKNILNYRRGSFPQPYTEDSWYGGENSMPFVQVNDVATNSFKLKETTKNTISTIAMPKSVFVEKGTILVTIQGSIGRIALTQYDSYVDRTLLIITDNIIEFDKYFLINVLYLLFYKEKFKASGGTIKSITTKKLGNFKISFPSIEEQEKIGNFFKNLDSKIEAEEKLLDSYKMMKKSLLQKMFV